ncbi:hypothetical protein LSTR_LSTR007729 [Laodelphax striatellus]|uniref:Phorbol-ester/DAG-type domain-containing protein n=1 Tax=Laodelphax striatellus TaxID=195883 RepID=A0A482WX17_LAOST|nr:hypothetical protein LSTR_LSTR007729 [Laodelphax striatellus]
MKPEYALIEPEPDSQNHAFRSKVFKKPRPCHLCHQPIHHQGSCCRVCKYVCHKTCETKIRVQHICIRYAFVCVCVCVEWIAREIRKLNKRTGQSEREIGESAARSARIASGFACSCSNSSSTLDLPTAPQLQLVA